MATPGEDKQGQQDTKFAEHGPTDEEDPDMNKSTQPLLDTMNITGNNEESGQMSPRTPVDEVRYMLVGDKDEDEDVLNHHNIFCQMDVLCHFDDGVMGWKEVARWLKYEERVDPGNRWSKPHVATTRLHALFEIRRAVADKTVVLSLDVEATHGCMYQVAELIVKMIKEQKDLPEDKLAKILDVLVKPHKHRHRESKKAPDAAPHDHDVKKKKFQVKNDLDDMAAMEYMYPRGTTPGDLVPHKPNKRMLKKMPGDSEAVNILVGQVDFLEEPVMVLVRLDKAAQLADVCEVALPTKFVFLVLGPPESTTIWEYEEVGRAMAALMSDKVFVEVAYKATSGTDILHGIDEFLDELTVLPPSVWDPSTRLEPPQKTLTSSGLRRRLDSSKREAGPEPVTSEGGHEDPSLVRTGRLFGGVINDIKSRYKHYRSDITDGLHMQCLASVVFMYFACITPIVTFGGLLGHATDGVMGTMETIMSGAICGIIYSLFSGQPLTIVGATGPLLVFESIVYTFSKDYGLDFLGFRCWIGLWVSLMLFIFVIFDLSFLVKYITRFCEESFSVLISLIFMIEAFKKVFGILHSRPLHLHVTQQHENYTCHCTHPPNVTDAQAAEVAADRNFVTHPTTFSPDANVSLVDEPVYNFFNWTNAVNEDCINYQHKIIVGYGCVDGKECTDHGWKLEGPACDDHSVTYAVPDVFFFSCFLFLGTFGIAMVLRMFRTSRFFPSIVRTTVSDFAVFTSIVICTGTDIFMGLPTPKLRVPAEFKNTIPGRGWIVNPLAILPDWYLIPLAIIPALLAMILIFLDQQITAVIVNRKEHKLKKGHGYHLDLMVLCIMIAICSIMGLPWFVAATVRAITHVRSLMKESEIKTPGEKPQMLGVREQRVTTFFIHILIGVSVFLTPILKMVPMPVLYGVFLYMGVTSLNDVQFVDRILILFMPEKYQPDYIYLRHVQTKKVHIFTGVQIVCMVAMWVMKSIKAVSITFPLMILALCFVRKAFDFIFTQSEMFWLDHILPDESRRKKEDQGVDHDDSDVVVSIDSKESPADAEKLLEKADNNNELRSGDEKKKSRSKENLTTGDNVFKLQPPRKPYRH